MDARKKKKGGNLAQEDKEEDEEEDEDREGDIEEELADLVDSYQIERAESLFSESQYSVDMESILNEIDSLSDDNTDMIQPADSTVNVPGQSSVIPQTTSHSTDTQTLPDSGYCSILSQPLQEVTPAQTTSTFLEPAALTGSPKPRLPRHRHSSVSSQGSVSSIDSNMSMGFMSTPERLKRNITSTQSTGSPRPKFSQQNSFSLFSTFSSTPSQSPFLFTSPQSQSRPKSQQSQSPSSPAKKRHSLNKTKKKYAMGF